MQMLEIIIISSINTGVAICYYYCSVFFSILFIGHSLVMWSGLWNLMKLGAMLCRPTQDGQVIVRSSNKMWPTGGGNGNLLQYSYLESTILLLLLFATPRTVAHQAPLSVRFSRQEYWSGLPFFFSRGSFQPRDQTRIPCIGRWILYHLGNREAWRTTMDNRKRQKDMTREVESPRSEDV